VRSTNQIRTDFDLCLDKSDLTLNIVDIEGFVRCTKETFGLRIAPITLIDGQIFYGPFGDQLKGIENALGLNCAI